MLSEEIQQAFFDLFIQRQDTYAIQTEKGGYQRTEEALTKQDITLHLNGEKTIGAYQYNKENNLKWICFDFDGENLEEQFEKAKKLYTKLIEIDKIQSIALEFSGMKGYHVWVFCKEANGVSAKYYAEEISKGYEAHEIFPKQEKIDDKFGNCVKLPLGLHQVSKKKSHFFNKDFEALNTMQSCQLLKEIMEKPKVEIPKIIVREIIRTIIKNPVKQEMPNYVEYLINNGADIGDRHEKAFIIIKELYNASYPKEEILEKILQFNKNCSQPKPEHTVLSHANYLMAFPDKYLTKEITKELLSSEELRQIEKIEYSQVLETYKKWIYFENSQAIDLLMAIAISRTHCTVPLWIIMIAPSGSGKSELLRPLEDKNNPSTTETMSKITPNTFLSGWSLSKMMAPDFAETLSGNPKLFLTFDFAQFVKMDSKDKAQVWAQLRDLYDGFIERKAAGVSKKANNIKINWLICSTPVVDSELLIHQELGTRELIYRFDSQELKEEDLMERVWENCKKLEEMRKELWAITRPFIEKKESEYNAEIEITKEAKKEIKNLAKTTAVLRAAAESDPYTGELTNFVYEEMPTRILQQLRTLFIALKNLDENYSDEMALQVLRKVVLSSIHPIRLRILIELLKQSELSTTDLQKRLSIGWKTTITQLYTAKQLGLVDFSELQEEEGNQRNWKKKLWRITRHPVARYLACMGGLESQYEAIYKL